MCSPSAASLTCVGLDLSACLEKLMSLNSALPVPPPPRPPPPMLVTPHEKLSISISPLCFSSRDSPSLRSEEHTSELQSLMRISYAVFCLKKKNKQHNEEQHKRDIKHNHTDTRYTGH